MKLSFHAKCGAKDHPPPVVQWPGTAPGQFRNYVGRKYDRETRVHKALPKPVEVDSESADGRRLAKICSRDYDLWPADEATAAFCGRPFVRVSQGADGEWRPVAAAAEPVKTRPDNKPAKGSE